MSKLPSCALELPKCKNFEELLSLKIDTIFIATYVKYLSEYTIKALGAGLNVFCEKPPAINLKEMSKIIEKEKESSGVLKYGFNHRYHHYKSQKIIQINCPFAITCKCILIHNIANLIITTYSKND